MKKPLKDKLTRLVLPMICIPIIASGLSTFGLHYHDASNRLDQYLKNRVHDIKSLSSSTSIENYFINERFNLKEEVSYFRDEIGKLFLSHFDTHNSTTLVYHSFAITDSKGGIIVQQGKSGLLTEEIADSGNNYIQQIKVLPKDDLFMKRISNRIIYARPIYVDFNPDKAQSKDEYCGFLTAESVYPFWAYAMPSLQTALITIAIMVLALLVAYFLIRRFLGNVTKPLSDLSEIAENISGGNFNQTLEIYSNDEIGDLSDSFKRMVKNLKESYKRIQRQIELLKSLTVSSKNMSTSLNPGDALTQTETALKQTLGIDFILFILLNKEDHFCHVTHHSDPFGGTFQDRPLEQNEEVFLKKILDEKRAVHFLNEKQREAILSSLQTVDQGIHYFAIPMVSSNRPMGIILAADSRRDFSDEELDYISSIANSAAISLENGRLYLEFKDANENLQETLKELKSTQAHLLQAQKMEAIGTLAGGIAHDFNNILYAIIGYTELALQDVSRGSELHTFLNETLKAGLRAKELVKQILTFSRQDEHEQKPIVIFPAIKEALKLLRATLPSNIEIRQNILTVQDKVIADPTKIHQVLMNLCTNASHAMGKNGGTLEVDLDKVDSDEELISKHPDLSPGSFMRLTVKDTGDGMAPGVVERIFEPYFTTKEEGKGTGLGLAQVHGIIQNYKGIITVQSEPEKGTTFEVYLPITHGGDGQRKEIDTEIGNGRGKVLFIDDEQALVNMGKHMLKKMGYQVFTKTNSLEALELFKVRPDRFDLVITDMNMPELNGEQLALQLIAIRPDIPIILCTGYSEQISEEKAKSIGIKAFAMKPLSMQDLSKTIRNVLVRN